MGMTIVEKIPVAHCGKDVVRPGEIENVKVDFVVGNEAPCVLTVQDFYRMGATKAFDPDRIAVVPDHLTPNRGIPEAETCKFIHEQVYSMFVAVLVATIMMFIVGFFYTAVCSKLSSVNMAYMIPAVMAVCTVGVFATRGMMFDVFLFLIFGVIGYTMVQSGFQYTPLVLGIVMGKIAEDNFSIAIKVSQGSWGIFFDGGICIAIWILLVLSIVGPWYVKRLGEKRAAAGK